MKYKSIAHPILLMFAFVLPILILIIPTIFFCILSNENSLQNASVILILYCFICFIILIFYHNAFCSFEMDFRGIRNRRLSLRWEDIKKIEISEVELFRFSIFPTVKLDSVICIGNVEKRSFLFHNSKDCIFFSMSHKNLEAMKKFAKNKSALLDDFLNFYSTPKC